jgi:hypothetical protein
VLVVALSVLAPLAAAAILLRRRARRAVPALAPPEPVPVRVLAEAVPAPATISGDVESPAGDITLDPIDALLAELESATVRIHGADALDEGSVAELESLAARLEAAAESFAPR